MFKNKYILIRNFALLFVAGNMVGWLFPFPNVVWRVSLVLLSVFVIYVRKGKRQPSETAILIFAGFNLLHYMVSFLWQTPSTTQIGNILMALLPLSIFVLLSEKEVMTNRFITIAAITLLVLSVLEYGHYERMVLTKMGWGIDEDVDITNNATTTFLMLLPILFLIKNNILKWVMLIVCIFFLLMGAKRGNIVAAIIPIILFVHSSLKNSRRSGLKTIAVLIAIVAVAGMTYWWVESNDYLMYRIEQTQEGNSSGRDVIYAGAWRVWSSTSNVFTFLFGYGFDATIHRVETEFHHAHNDWLEVLVNYGLLGFVLYLIVFITFARQIRRTKNFNTKMLLYACFAIWFAKSLFSMGFTNENMCLLMLIMGIALGQCKAERRIYEKNLIPSGRSLFRRC